MHLLVELVSLAALHPELAQWQGHSGKVTESGQHRDPLRCLSFPVTPWCSPVVSVSCSTVGTCGYGRGTSSYM